jgi:hypothetical protein
MLTQDPRPVIGRLYSIASRNLRRASQGLLHATPHGRERLPGQLGDLRDGHVGPDAQGDRVLRRRSWSGGVPFGWARTPDTINAAILRSAAKAKPMRDMGVTACSVR